MRASLAAGPFEFRPVPHALFSAKGEGAVATLYASGKLVVQAADPEVFVQRWLSLEAPPIRSAEVVEPICAPVTDEAVIGSDEVGKGDYFGPLVVCAVRLEPGQSDEIRRSGVRDSKTLTDEQCIRLGGALRSRYAVAVERLDPVDYNRVYVPGKLNDLLADQHTKAISRLATPGVHVVVDRFANERLLVTRMKKLGVRLEQRVRAESEPAVAAASVVAREEFLTALKELSEEVAVHLHKGAGPPVDQAARKFVALHGFDALNRVAKLHFKTTQKIGGGR
jgi:ribonuclease HIII